MSLDCTKNGWIQISFEMNNKKDVLILKQIARQHHIKLWRLNKKNEWERYVAMKLPKNQKLLEHFIRSIIDEDGTKLFKQGVCVTKEEMIQEGYKVGNTELFITFYQGNSPLVKY